MDVALQMQVNQIVQGDCIKNLNQLPQCSVDLVFADPPFNIGYEYDVYDDKKGRKQYLSWSREWISAVHRVLKENGTFWLAIGDEYAAELKVASQEVGFSCRSWVIWYYTFGVNCKNKFSRSHAHLFYFVKDAKEFTFNSSDLDNRIPSARQLVYADNRANPVGRLPDDTWVLRPQDLAGCFTPAEDTWYFPRVAGTFKERAGFHGCQMPEQLLGRIIRLCSNPDDLVLDPFSGSATTAVVAKKLGRRYLGFDLSPEYVTRGCERLKETRVGDPLEGSPEPTVSAPRTPIPKAATSTPVARETSKSKAISPQQVKSFAVGLLEAYRRTYAGFSLDRVVADPELNSAFSEACNSLGLPGEPKEWNWSLFGLRKKGAFAATPTIHRTEFSWEHCEPYLFASEIAWRQIVDQGCDTLDSILCDPKLALEFDTIAKRWAPGHTPLEYRWAALKLRKNASLFRTRAESLPESGLSKAIILDSSAKRKAPSGPGIYVVGSNSRKPLYVGGATNIRERLSTQFGSHTRHIWKELCDSLTVRYFEVSCPYTDRMAHQWRLVSRHQPPLNLLDSRFHEGHSAISV
jgi:site-specific DNA-methyltransferase (adenine-specific)